jgi:hypothetical protein
MVQIPHADPGLICPLHKIDMAEVCHKCPWWTQIKGKHPQTGVDLDQWACAITLLPMLLIEGAKESRSTGAAVESFRNEMVNANKNNMVFSQLVRLHRDNEPQLALDHDP